MKILKILLKFFHLFFIISWFLKPFLKIITVNFFFSKNIILKFIRIYVKFVLPNPFFWNIYEIILNIFLYKNISENCPMFSENFFEISTLSLQIFFFRTVRSDLTSKSGYRTPPLPNSKIKIGSYDTTAVVRRVNSTASRVIPRLSRATSPCHPLFVKNFSQSRVYNERLSVSQSLSVIRIHTRIRWSFIY